MKAFVLGAGLGTRLRPLTERRPKPLVPIHGKPLITFAFDHLIANGASSLIVNTHHCPEAFPEVLGTPLETYRDLPLTLRHEPVLLETGGGIKNIQDLIGDEPFIVYNGDVLADFPLREAILQHKESKQIASLMLRSSGGPLHIQAKNGVVTDIRNTLSTNSDPSYLFTGISILSPEIFDHIPANQVISIVPIYLDLIRAGREIGAVVCDQGLWLDLGTRDAYIAAHALMGQAGNPLSYLSPDWPPSSTAPAGVKLEGFNSISPSAKIGKEATLRDCIVWERATITPGSQLTRCIVRDGELADGKFSNRDF